MWKLVAAVGDGWSGVLLGWGFWWDEAEASGCKVAVAVACKGRASPRSRHRCQFFVVWQQGTRARGARTLRAISSTLSEIVPQPCRQTSRTSACGLRFLSKMLASTYRCLLRIDGHLWIMAFAMRTNDGG